jgi:hypothetical protein
MSDTPSPTPPPPTIFAVKPINRSKAHSNGEPAEDELDLFSTAQSQSSGYEAWQSQQLEQKKAFEKKWGIPLGCRVRIQLTTQGRPIEGLIRLASDDLAPATAKERFLRIQDTVFSPREVESLTRV